MYITQPYSNSHCVYHAIESGDHNWQTKRIVIPFLYIDSALMAIIKFFQSGARCPAYEDWCEERQWVWVVS